MMLLINLGNPNALGAAAGAFKTFLVPSASAALNIMQTTQVHIT
jgi:hypothetical protein